MTKWEIMVMLLSMTAGPSFTYFMRQQSAFAKGMDAGAIMALLVAAGCVAVFA